MAPCTTGARSDFSYKEVSSSLATSRDWLCVATLASNSSTFFGEIDAICTWVVSRPFSCMYYYCITAAVVLTAYVVLNWLAQCNERIFCVDWPDLLN